MKTYRVPKALVLFQFAVLGIMMLAGLVVGPALLAAELFLPSSATQALSRAQFVAVALIYAGYLVVLLFALRGVLRSVTEITIHIDDRIEFRSPLRRTVLTPREINSIAIVSMGNLTATRIGHRRGRLDVPGDMSELVPFLKGRNPMIQVTRRGS